ncbi:MAG: hypothetical protein V4850_30635 [Myxococcota bacterium]
MDQPASDPRYAPLLARRVPPEEIVAGVAYVIHARNGGIGVAVMADGRIGYRLRREKMGRVFLFVEWDWDEGPPHGTVVPLGRIDEAPPAGDDAALLRWLAEKEEEHADETRAAWDVVLGRA